MGEEQAHDFRVLAVGYDAVRSAVDQHGEKVVARAIGRAAIAATEATS